MTRGSAWITIFLLPFQGNRESPWSMVVSNQTQEAAPSSAPRDLIIQSIEDRPTSVLLRWQPPKQPNGPITGI